MKEKSRIGQILSTGALLLVLLLPALEARSQDRQITVGGKNFTEQYVLANLAKLMLEKNDFEVTLRTGVGTAVARRALLNAQIDLYYEYTGTAYTVFYKKSERDIMTNEQKVYEWVKKSDAGKGLVWLKQVQFNNTYTLMMREDQAEKLGILTISDLADYINKQPAQLVIGVNAEFWERPDGFKPLMEHYDFRVPYGKVKKMDSGLVYKALHEGNVDVSMGFATDGRIKAFDFFMLKDDKNYFPVYSPAPVVRKEVIKKYPKIGEILEPVADNLTTEKMQQLNAAIDVQHIDVKKVARSWLQQEGILE